MGSREIIKKNLWLYERLRQRRSQLTDRRYVEIRDKYYKLTKGLFEDPGYLQKSRELLSTYWDGPRVIKDRPGQVRIFVVFATVAGAACWYRAISGVFDVIWIDHAEYNDRMEHGDQVARAQFQTEFLSKFEAAHKEKPVDLVWVHAYRSHIDPETLNHIRSMGVPVALHSLDDKHAFKEDKGRGFPNGISPLIGSVDVHLTNSIESVRWYVAEGYAGYFMPQAVEPEVFKPIACKKDIDVSFIGAAYGMRRSFVDKLVKAGVNVTCFGRGWGNPFLSGADQITIYNRSWINLGIGGVASSDRITCIKGRDMSIPGSGNVLLTMYDSELAKMWHIGKEILCYYNEIDSIDQIRYYLERPSELIEIGQSARKRALDEHTWTHRIKELLIWMGILVPGTVE